MSMAKKWFHSTLAAALGAALMLPACAHAAPSIADVFPDHAPMQAYVTIHGSGFGDTQGTGYVTMGGRWLPVASWSDNAIHVLTNPLIYKQSPPALDTVYSLQVVTGAGSSVSNTCSFTLTSGAAPVYAPFVDPITPANDPALECLNGTLFCDGDTVTIYGSGFGAAQGTGFVTISVPFLDAHGNLFMQEFAAPVLAWSDRAVEVVLDVPSGAQPGTYALTVHASDGTTATGSITAGTRVNGNCVPGNPKLMLDTNYISFADLKIGGTTWIHCFKITNTGTGPLNITGIGLVDCSDSVDPINVDCSAVAGFAIVSGGSPGTLAPGESRYVCATFSPHRAATFDGYVAISSNASPSPVFVQFHGTGDN